MDAVGLQVQNPDFLGKLSNLLSIRQQQQQLQGSAAIVQQEQIRAESAKATQDFYKSFDPSDNLDSDGTISLDKAMQSPAFKKSGIAKQDIMAHLLDVKNKGLQAKTALTNLNGTLAAQLGTALGTIAKDDDVLKDKTDPTTGINPGRQKIDHLLAGFSQEGPDAARIAQIFGPITQHAPPGKLANALQSMQMLANSASEQQALVKPQPQFVQGPKGLQAVETNAYAPGGVGTEIGAPVKQGIAPGLVTSPNTGAVGVTSPSGTVKPLTDEGKGSSSFNPTYAGQKEDIARNQEEIRAVRSQGDQAPLAHNINQQILKLSSDTRTGPGTDAWQHVIGALGAPFGLSPSASYQELGKYLEKNAIANMQSMGGPPSDARLSAAAAANGSTSFSPRALQAVTKFNDATTTALQMYRQGLDTKVGLGRNADYLQVPEFKSKWAKNFDVNVFRFDNALRDGDTQEIEQIKRELGPRGAADLAKKRRNLHALAEHGDLND